MISKFIQVNTNLFRGSAPSPKDVKWLQDKFGIKKIVSLDQNSGNIILNTCKLLNINQIIILLNKDKKSLLKFLSFDLKDLLNNNGPVFVHCKHGKDRTGLAVALYECKYNGKSPNDAIKEAKKLGFGVGVDPEFTRLYESVISSCKPQTDNNNADIVSNQRKYKGDSKDSPLDEANQVSLAPYSDVSRQYPSSIYNSINDQYPTRENHNDKSILQHSLKNEIFPIVGLYDNSAGINGAGPSENVASKIFI